ncbi:DNA-3-methyladenine glycosylase family protein [Phormidesmis priestleyi]|uniref:DNA-3-methyladenine glycosylase family protein n=1 Tax=Phormidesmis priestleyi TaxID=268141 RepID=UPI000AA71DF1|nr:DNA-3-methyladenine glycosylase [Phormidesmis priestleyi]
MKLDYSIAVSALKQSDPILAAVIDRVGECTLDQTQHPGDLLYSLSRSIISQQLSTKAASAIHRRFLTLYLGMPTAQEILDTADEDLRGVGLSRSKVLYMRDLANHVLNGLPTLTDLETIDDETIIQTLTQVKGIGRWSVQMMLIFRLHRWDVLPVDDLGIRTGIRRAYQYSDIPNKAAIEELGKVWQPYRTIASWYLWRSLENV